LLKGGEQSGSDLGMLVGEFLFDGDQMMLISDKGTLVRTRTDEVSVLSRNTQGVRLIRLAQEDERLVGVERIAESDDEEEVEGEETEE